MPKKNKDQGSAGRIVFALFIVAALVVIGVFSVWGWVYLHEYGFDDEADCCDDSNICTYDYRFGKDQLGCGHAPRDICTPCTSACYNDGTGFCNGAGTCVGVCKGDCTVTSDCPNLVGTTNVTGTCHATYHYCEYTVTAVNPFSTINTTDTAQPLFSKACFAALGQVTMKDCLEVTIPQASSLLTTNMTCIFTFGCAIASL